MAKQTSLIKINGKADGQSFYTSKNGGALMRSINKGMSARVKDSKEYVNTRKNNAEFGACGDFAGAFIGAITQRWRFILDSVATGKMVKALKEALTKDTEGKWGERNLGTGQFPAIRAAFNSFSKNDMIESVVAGMAVQLSYDAATSKYQATAEVKLSEDESQVLESLGATGVDVKYYALLVHGLEFNSETNAYPKATVDMQALENISAGGDLSAVGGVTVLNEAVDSSTLNPGGDTGFIGGVLAIMLPYRTVGGVKNVLQQHCAAYYANVTVA